MENAPKFNAPPSAVFDNGRRGAKRPGCDCEQCFGYCLVDSAEATREALKQHRSLEAAHD